MVTREQTQAAMRLFKGYLVENTDDMVDSSESIKYGVIFDTNEVPKYVFDLGIEMYGKKPEDWNKTFHKSVSTVLDTPIEVLVVQQIVHYITTYGFESLGIYDKDTVYIPKENLEIPELEVESVSLAVIKQLTEAEISSRLMTLVSSGIALSKETVKDIMELSDYIDLDMIDDVNNREVRAALYEKYNLVPSNNIDFLRYLIRVTTGETLLIKNKAMEDKLREVNNEQLFNLLSGYVNSKWGYVESEQRWRKYKPGVEYTDTITGYDKLAQIYNRYKRLFVPMKRSDKRQKYAKELNALINRIMRLSKTEHKPMKVNVLDTITQIKTQTQLDKNKNLILEELDKITTFREIRILNSLKYRQFKETDAMVYKIRNGKAWVDNEENTKINKDTFKELYLLIANHLRNRLYDKVNGKTVYIPEGISYTAPQSEKQFNGNIPEGSYLEVPRNSNMVIGVHWNNVNHERIDLDLKMQDKNQSFGWDAAYRSGDSRIAFSGDVVDPEPTNGATEVFYIDRNCRDSVFLLTLNKYTSNRLEVPFEFFIANTDDNYVDKNYMVNPNKVLATIQNKFHYDEKENLVENQLTLGLVMVKNDTVRFYFNDFSLGSSIVSRQNDIIRGAYDYLVDYSKYQIKLDKLLESAGAKIINTPEVEKVEYKVTSSEGVVTMFSEEEAENTKLAEGETTEPVVTKVPADINLSLDNISKDTIIEIMMEDK